MNSKLKESLSKLVSEALVYSPEIWATSAYSARVDQYINDFRRKNSRAPDKKQIDRFAGLMLSEDWSKIGKDHYEKTVEKIVDRLCDEISKYRWLSKFKDRALALSVFTVSVFSMATIAENKQFSLVYGAIGIAAAISLIFAIKVIWHSFVLDE